TMAILLNGLTKREINFPDHELMTAVHWAAFHDRPEHLMHLIQKGGDVLARDVDGKLPLHWAAQNGSFQCTHRLISLTEGLAMVNDVDSSGKSPAHYAAAAGSANILKIIEKCETVDLEMEDPDERTPLHWAAAMGHAGAVETLLKLGVNPNPHDCDGYTPMDYAIQTGSKECVKIFETHLGHNATGVKEKKKYQLSHEDLRRKANQASSSGKNTQSGPGHKNDVPAITVQPPTTTLSKATTNPGAMYPRMYSASTDTDVHVCQHQSPDSRSGTPATARHVNCNYKEPPTVRWAREDAHGGALSKLVGASYVLAAQAPILHGSGEGEGENGGEVGATKQAEHSKEHPTSPREEASLDTEQDNVYKWASAAPGLENITSNPDSALVTGHETADASEPPEPQITTSGNTPELQRVSVQSFRSVPPITGGSAKKDAGIPRQPADRTKGLRLQAARLTPLPGISPKGGSVSPVESRQEDPPTPRKTTELEPLAPLRGPLRVLDEDINPPASHRSNVAPVDFMTENNAETRILTRKYKNTLSRFYDISIQQQAAQTSAKANSNSKPSHSTTATTATQSTNPSTNLLTGGNNHPSVGYKDTRVKFFKHSRIPSTHMGAHHPDSTNAISARRQYEAAATGHLQIPQGKSNQRSTTILSSAGVFRTIHDKYIRDEEETTAQSPTPLAGQPSSILAATLGGRRRAQERLLGHSDSSRKKHADTRGTGPKLHQPHHNISVLAQQHQHHETDGNDLKSPSVAKRSVNFKIDQGVSRNTTQLQNSKGFHNSSQRHAGVAESQGTRRLGESRIRSRREVNMPVLRQANLVKSKN
ncbi:ankyrin repeat domain-containing protein 55-like, partial [Elysia marginata]